MERRAVGSPMEGVVHGGASPFQTITWLEILIKFFVVVFLKVLVSMQCLDLDSSVLMLNLQRSNFDGDITPMCEESSVLKTLDLWHNELQGKILKPLIRCKSEEFQTFDTILYVIQSLDSYLLQNLLTPIHVYSDYMSVNTI